MDLFPIFTGLRGRVNQDRTHSFDEGVDIAEAAV